MIGLGIGLAFHSAIAAFVLAVFGAVMGHRLDTLHELPEEDPLLTSFPEDEFQAKGLSARSRRREGRSRFGPGKFGADSSRLGPDGGEGRRERRTAKGDFDDRGDVEDGDGDHDDDSAPGEDGEHDADYEGDGASDDDASDDGASDDGASDDDASDDDASDDGASADDAAADDDSSDADADDDAFDDDVSDDDASDDGNAYDDDHDGPDDEDGASDNDTDGPSAEDNSEDDAAASDDDASEDDVGSASDDDSAAGASNDDDTASDDDRAAAVPHAGVDDASDGASRAKAPRAAAPSRPSPAASVPPRRQVHQPAPPALDLTTAACGVLVELARVDGDVNKDEIAVAREYFEQTLRFGPIALQKVRNELKAALAQQRELQPLAQSCRAGLDARGRVTFLNALYQLALADGELRKSERDTLRLVARELGITEEAHRALTRAYFGDGSEQYALLGVDPDVTDEELKSAFRRLAAEHHPDRFAHQGRDAVDAASDRFRRLQEAYEELRRIRSF